MSNNNNSWFRNLFRRRPTAEEELNAAAEERRQQARAAQNEATQRLAEARAAEQREIAALRARHQQEMHGIIRPPAPPVGLPAENRRALFPPRRREPNANELASREAIEEGRLARLRARQNAREETRQALQLAQQVAPRAPAAEATIITNDNIHILVNQYLRDRNMMPEDIREIPIGDWDVSRVTDMSFLFSDERRFNEPLNDWNVSNVRNMEGMFENAFQFNQPLDRWNVSRVRNMISMFSGARSFNQDIGNWNVSNVRNMISMFSGASRFSQNPNWNIGPNVRTENMFSRTAIGRQAPAARPPQTAVAATVGVAFEIHDAFDNFKMAKFMDIIRREIGTNPPPENMSRYFQNPNRPLTALFEFIENREQINKLMTIQSTIISYPGYETNRQNVIDVIKFVVTQPEEFITAYIQTLITDCMRAYSTGRATSCVKGMYERVFFSVRDTVATVCLDQMQGTGPAPLCKPVYIELFECFYEVWPKEGPGGLNEMLGEWYGDGEAVTALSPENRIESFVNFVRDKINDPARFRQAEKSIRDYARSDLNAMFGGRRRKKRSVKKRSNKRNKRSVKKRCKKTMKRKY